MKKSNFLFIAIFAIIVLRIGFVVVLPVGQSVTFHLEGLNDEPSHFNYVKYLFENRAFPVQNHTYKDSGALIRNDFEYYHPPLYYLLCTPGYALCGSIASLYFCRLISFFCGLAALWLIVLLFKKMGASAQAQGGVLLLCGFFPCLAYFSSLTSNDALSWLFALLIVYTCMSDEPQNLQPRHFSWKRTIGLGLLLGLGSLVKSSLLLLYPLVAGCFLYSWYQRKNISILIRLTTMLGLAVAMNLPWFIRNLKLYHSFTALGYTNGPSVSYPHLLTGQGFIIFLKTSVRFFWFPMQHIPASPGQKILGAVGTVILVIVGALALKFIITKISKRAFGYNHALLVGLFALNLAAYVQYNLVWGNREGRFLMPSLGSLAFFAVIPLQETLAALRLTKLFFPLCMLLGLWGYSYLFLTF